MSQNVSAEANETQPVTSAFTEQPVPPFTLTLPEVAQALRISKASLYRHMAVLKSLGLREIPRFGRARLFSRESVEELARGR